MQGSLLKWCLFLLAISRIQGGLVELWKPNNYVVNHRSMKIILDTCYESDSGANPTLIFGDFREFIDKSSIIWLNQLFHSDIEFEYLFNRTGYQPSKIILIEDSLEQLAYDLHLLSGTRWWNNTASLFIVEKNDNTCRNAREMLMVSWEMDILNSIYICTRSGKTLLVTINLITNYAPSPWKTIEKSKDHNFFHQYFDSEISCKNLHYDKLRVIHGYDIKVGARAANELPPGEYSFEKILSRLPNALPFKFLNCVVKSLNATGKVYMRKDDYALFELLRDTSIDMAVVTTSDIINNNWLMIYPEWMEVVAVIKLSPEISTLTKIHQLWSVPVLIAAAVAIGILLMVLTVLNNDFSLAILDLTRLLTYTSVLIHNRSHKFRFYFTTMLIFIVISNGVFQGRIAAFLTKQERASPVRTVDELIELRYKMYIPQEEDGIIGSVCPECDIKETSYDQCIELVFNSSRHACLIPKQVYEEFFNLRALDYVRVSTMPRNDFLMTRLHYPLRNRIRKTIMNFFESGIMEMWKNHLTHRQKNIRQAIEDEWSSPRYKPVKLYKLKFAFQVLALGLSISSIVFFLELLVARYRQFCKLKGRFSISIRDMRIIIEKQNSVVGK